MSSILKQAVVLSALVTLASLPRQIEHNESAVKLAVFVGLQFVLSLLAADAPAAWGTRGGMVGLWPGRRRLLIGIAVSVLTAAVLLPAHLATDPSLRQALENSGQLKMLRMMYPTTVAGCLAGMLWASGFEVLLFYAFAMSVVARATQRQWPAIVVAILLRTGVSVYKLAEAGILASAIAPLGVGALTAAAVALLYARAGFAPASLLVLLIRARHLVEVT